MNSSERGLKQTSMSTDTTVDHCLVTVSNHFDQEPTHEYRLNLPTPFIFQCHNIGAGIQIPL